MLLLLLLCLFAASAEAQQDLPRGDARELLLEVRKKVMLTIDRLPKYLCTETVDRSTFQPEATVSGRSCDDLASRGKKPDWKIRKYTSDRLRLDVAVSGDSEMYSWVGENHFEDRSLADLVRDGATSTGTFSSFLTSIFGTDAASFTYNGDVNTEGRLLAEFGFRVPVEKSGYRISNKLHNALVGYDGAFWVDPNTFDLVRLRIHADQLPAELHACEDITTLEYSGIRLNNSEFLLPKDVRWLVVNADGSEFENRTHFSSCHEYLGESTLQFDVTPETGQAEAQKTVSRGLALPAGLPFTIALAHEINTATAAAGDPIQGKLTQAIGEKHDGVLVPKGAVVTGRIVQIKRHYGPSSQSLTLALKLESIELNGVPQRFDTRLESVVKRRRKPLAALHQRQDLGTFDQMSDPKDPGDGFLKFEDVTGNYVIHRGLEITGSTAAPK